MTPNAAPDPLTQTLCAYRDDVFPTQGSSSDVLGLRLFDLEDKWGFFETPNVRHYGQLANRNRKAKIARCRVLLEAPKPEEPTPQTRRERLLELIGVDIERCPVCREGRMAIVGEIDRPPPLSLHPHRVMINDSS